MCGFVAVFGPGEPLALPLLERMRDRLAHRGPDGSGAWVGRHAKGSIALGFRRLAIIDTRQMADQPMLSMDGRKVIVFNGEIYNFIELRGELEAAGRVFQTRSDTEVLLQGYEHWGEAVVERLNGMFAFVIWDEMSGQVFIARDRFGEKPLFSCRLSDGKIAFASEIKALLEHPDADASYDLAMFSRIIGGYESFGAEATIFRDVMQFPAAHCVTLGVNGEIIRKRRYWSPSYGNTLAKFEPEELENRLRDHLERSLVMRMRSDVPVTACLSGGLDSSSLVALLADFPKESGRIESAISVRFPNDLTIDESHFINIMLDQTGLKGHSVFPKSADLMRDMRKLHWHHETIIPGTSMYLEWSLMRHARHLGYKVIIDGQGADEVLGGYACYLRAYQAELGAKGLAGLLKALALGRKRDARLEFAAREYHLSTRRFASHESLKLHQYFTFQKRWIPAKVREYGGDGMPSPDAVKALRFELALNLLRTSLPANLYSGDRNSMAHGIESRYPFLDYQLVDFATQLPDNAYNDYGWSKSILRNALADKLPPEITWRVDKVGFAAPQDDWLVSPELKNWVQDRIFDQALVGVAGYSRAEMVKEWGRLRSGVGGNAQLLWKWASAAELLDMGRTGAWKGEVSSFQIPSPQFLDSDADQLEPLGLGAYLSKGRAEGERTAWIISYTPVSKEPRVLRQAKALEGAGWKVVVFGFDGLTPPPKEWIFVSVQNASPDWGGIKKMIFVRILNFFMFGAIILANYGFISAIKKLGARLAHFTSYSYFWRGQVIRGFADKRSEYRPDIVLAHDYFTSDIAVEMGKKFEVPVVVDCHEYALGQYAHVPHWVKWHQTVVRELQDYLFPKVDGFTVVCDGIADLIARDHVLQRPPRVVRSLPFFSPQPFRPTGDIVTVLYHGEIFPARALHIAVRSMRLWRPEFRFVLRGYSDPAYIEKLRQIALEVGVADRLEIQSPVSFDRIVPTANDADIGYFAHLNISPQRSFALPNKFFEYIMAGLALVVSDLPEMARLVHKYECGTLIPECSEESIARAINSLDRASIDEMKRRSLAAAKDLNWDMESEKMMSFYQEILA
ncbi:MAG: asparagine synthase (glutamine-hydrolyzing) [Polynucleobacter sp.]|nr:asparagine synthase (glutamine-hydrolyzing) [Polynucleobacter sp.]